MNSNTIKSTLPKEDVLALLSKYGGTTKEILDNEQLVDLLIPILRKDWGKDIYQFIYISLYTFYSLISLLSSLLLFSLIGCNERYTFDREKDNPKFDFNISVFHSDNDAEEVIASDEVTNSWSLYTTSKFNKKIFPGGNEYSSISFQLLIYIHICIYLCLSFITIYRPFLSLFQRSTEGNSRSN